MCQDLLRNAVGLYQDDFMAGFTLRDSAEFDDWQFLQAEELRRQLSWALDQRMAGCVASHDFEQAIEIARRRLGLDFLHEPAHRALMKLYAWHGQRSLALRQYSECVRILDEELGVGPLEETTDLYEAIKENRVHAVPEMAGWASPRISTPPAETAVSIQTILPLVGRQREWDVLAAAQARTLKTGQMVILEGEAGIGKTRLGVEFIEAMRQQGTPTLSTRCYEGETHLMYGPIIQLLRNALGEPDSAVWIEAVPSHRLAEAARLLPEILELRGDISPPPPLDVMAGRARFYDGVTELLLTRLGSGGLLFIDDAHWADVASTEILVYLLRRLRQHPAMALMSWRLEAIERDNPLLALAAEGEREGWAFEITLPRLNREDISALVEAVQPDTAVQNDVFSTRLLEETAGLPLFLVEYLALSSEQSGEQELDWALPLSVQDVLRSRLVSVSEIGQQLLTTAAVIGHSFDYSTLREASGRSDEETVAAIETLTELRLIEEAGDLGENRDVVYDFYHPKLRTVIYNDTSQARRRLLHQRVGQILARKNRSGGPQAAEIAFHLKMARQDAEAASYYKLAGEQAERLYANREALEHFHEALALGFPTPSVLHEAIADIQTRLGNYSAALRSYEIAAATSPPECVPQIEHKLGNLYHRLGEWELAESYYQSALDALEEENVRPGLQAQMLADWGLTVYRRGDAARAQGLGQRALDLAADAGDDLAIAQAHNMLGILARSRADLASARDHLETTLKIAQSLRDLSAQVAALNNLSLVSSADGDVNQAIALSQEALGICHEQGDRHREAALHSNLADLYHTLGSEDLSRDHLTELVRILGDIGGSSDTLRPEIWKLTEW